MAKDKDNPKESQVGFKCRIFLLSVVCSLGMGVIVVSTWCHYFYPRPPKERQVIGDDGQIYLQALTQAPPPPKPTEPKPTCADGRSIGKKAKGGRSCDDPTRRRGGHGGGGRRGKRDLEFFFGRTDTNVRTYEERVLDLLVSAR